ncbi:MAG: helix-turn-helix transcriptional regulator [Lentisphaeria bacterium]
MSKTLIIAPGSVERFIAFPHHPGGCGWFDNGIALAGISALRPGYRVHHALARYHFAGYCTGGQLHYAGGRQSGSVTAGQFLFLPAGQLQHLDSDREFHMVWQLIEPPHPRWAFLAAQTAAVHRDWRCGREVATLAEWMYAETQSAAGTGDPVAAQGCRLLLTYLERELEYHASPTASRLGDRLEKLWLEVRRDLGRPWDVAQLARAVAMSPSHFHATVVRLCRVSPMQRVRQLRLDRAQNLLLTTEHTLERIAELTGYRSAFALSKSFRKVVGVSPRDFRRHRRGAPA